MLKTVAAFDRIGEENAFAVLARANALAAQGRDIINLGIGQPDFRTPNFIVEAAIKALRDGHHGYTPAVGIPPLREAVAADLGKRFKVGAAIFEGLELCEPCSLFAKRTHREVLKFFVGKGGLRAKIVTGAQLRVGDRVVLVRARFGGGVCRLFGE